MAVPWEDAGDIAVGVGPRSRGLTPFIEDTVAIGSPNSTSLTKPAAPSAEKLTLTVRSSTGTLMPLICLSGPILNVAFWSCLFWARNIMYVVSGTNRRGSGWENGTNGGIDPRARDKSLGS